MTYTEKELDQFLHGISLSLLSKKSAQHWRYDEETAKEIEWLEALERKVRADKADRKTEPTAYADGYADGQRDERERWERMANNLHRYGIMVHRKGTIYEDDFWFTDNKHFQIREFSHEAAEMAMRILHYQWGDGYSFRIRRLD